MQGRALARMPRLISAAGVHDYDLGAAGIARSGPAPRTEQALQLLVDPRSGSSIRS